MTEQFTALVSAAADVSSMGDKVAAFAIAQNFLWTLGGLKGDLRFWPISQIKWFLGGAVAAGIVYTLIEACLWWQARELISASGYTQEVCRRVISASNLLFGMRALGALASSVLSGFAFWGMSKGAADRADLTHS